MSNRFVFVVPTYNAKDTIQQMFLSVVSQTYSNWRIIFRDDLSTDGTPELIEGLTKFFGLSDRISLTRNETKKWEVQNIVEMIKEIDEDEIVCRLDGDDWLCDLDALAIIDSRYRHSNIGALWTNHRWGFTSQNISGPMAPNADPYQHVWKASHFKTFRKKLITSVSDENFRGEDGAYFKRIGDQAIYLPVLHNAAGRWEHLPITAYHYTIDMSPQTFQTDDAKFQRDEAIFLRQRGFLR